MGSSSQVGSGDLHPLPAPTSSIPPFSKWKTCGCAIAIIVGIGGLAAGAVGLADLLNNIVQGDAIVMMAVGGGGGTILLIMGIVGIVKNCINAARRSDSTERAKIIKSIDTQGGSVYGPEAWQIWKVKILNVVPPLPEVTMSKKDQVLLYIPEKVLVGEEEEAKDFTLNVLREISDGPFRYFSEEVAEQFGETRAPGWVLIDKEVLPESRNQTYETQKGMVEARGCSMPSVLEAVLLNLMVFAFTGERLYGTEPWTYTRCTEKVDDRRSIVVGSFDPEEGLSVLPAYNLDSRSDGVACVRRNFS